MNASGGWTARLGALNGLCACLVLSAIALQASGAVGPIHASLLAAAALYQRWRWSGRGGGPHARRWWWEAAAFATLLFFVLDLFVVTRNLIGAALRLLGFIVAYHADNPQTPPGARQTLALTFIQMLAASASTTEVSFSVLMASYLLAALYTLAALGAAEREDAAAPLSPRAPAVAVRLPLARLTGATAPVVVALGLAVFFCVPHYGTGYFRESGPSVRRSLSGFSDRIELGSIGTIKKSHATVLRVRLAGSDDPPPLPLRMRGMALDRYDGRTWSVTDARKKWLAPDDRGAYLVAPQKLPEGADPGAPPSGSPRDRRREPQWLALENLLEPLDTPVLFAPPDTVTVTTTRFRSVAVDRLGSLYAGGSTLRRFSYRTTSLARPAPPALPYGDEPPDGAEAYLQLPSLDPRIPAIAREVTAGIGSPEARAVALEKHLRENYAYSLDVNDAGVASPLQHFLIDRRPGHCEYFATALAVLLRTMGTPARVVNGLYGGDLSDLTGQAILRQSDAHAWVEAWIPRRGWVTLDPTPSDPGTLPAWNLLGRARRLIEETEIAWDTWIVGLDLEDQRTILQDVRDAADLALAGAMIRIRSAVWAIEEALGRPGRGAGVAVLAALAAALLLAAAAALRAAARALRRRGAKAVHPATEIFLRFERGCARRGLRRDPSSSPAAFARGAGAPEIAAAFESARYGPPAQRAAAMEALRREVAGAEARLRRGA